MFFRNVLLLAHLSLVACIFGGLPVEPGELPYNVLIKPRRPKGTVGESFCGSILSDWWILTAAHSLQNSSLGPQEYEVIAGKYSLQGWEKTEQVRTVRDVFSHPEYSLFIPGRHDVALLLLTKPLELNDFVQPITIDRNLATYPTGVGTVTGYGRIRPDGSKATFLRKLSVNILAMAVCANGHASWNPSLFCTDPGTCEEDSGAPVAQRLGNQWVQIGLMSFGAQCAFYGSPTYYTHLAQYFGWINNTLETTDVDEGGGAGRSLSGVLLVGVMFLGVVQVFGNTLNG